MPRRLIAEAMVLGMAVLIAIAIRLFLFAVYSIPSESMLPALRVGDYLLVAKWSYGWSGDGGPLARRLWRGRIAPRPPHRGDIVIFKAPPAERTDYIKRVIGLPGDRVALHGGVVTINGRAIVRRRMDDLIMPVTANSPCRVEADMAVVPDVIAGRPACRYPRYRETMPDGAGHAVLDIGRTDADDFGPVTVPAHHLFVLGDNRDRSADSRFPAAEGGAVGMVPEDDLVGRPLLILFSTDGSARLADPLSWWRALRGGRTFAPL